jgi:putative hydroxymethylpyrimidine transport system substrate-binding protein
MKTFCWVLALGTAAALLLGCGGGSTDGETVRHQADLQSVTLTFDGRVGPANVAIRMAQERGFFEEVGLNLSSGSPIYPRRPVTYVSAGTDQLGVTQLPEVVIAREKGIPIVAVGALVPQPTAAMIWLKKSGIRGLSDLKGKTIAIPDVAFQEGFLRSALARAGLDLEDVEIKRVGYELVSALLDGRADASFGGSWNIEGAALEARGARPVIKRVQSLGVPAYDELVVIARTDLVAKDPKMIRDFMSALARGVDATIKEPASAAKLIEESNESSPEARPKETKAGIEATLPLLSKTGYMDPAQASALATWMHEEGMTEKERPSSDLLTNEYLSIP